MGWLRTRRALWVVVACVLVVAGCGGGSGGGSGSPPPHGNVLQFGTPGEPATLDPAAGVGDALEIPPAYTIFDRLIGFDPKTLELRPALATKWAFAGPDRLTFQLTLRRGVTFQDGTPVDPAAVKFSLERYKSLGINHDIDLVSSVTTSGQDTVDVHLAKPYSVLPNVLTGRAGMIVSPAAVQKFGKDFARNPVGAGPFAFKSWKPGTQVDLTRYGGYWQKGQPKLAGITFKVIGNPASMAAAALAGQVDIATIDPSQLPAVRAGRDLNVRVDPTLSVYGIFFNSSLPPLNDVLVRRAVAMSLDRKAIAETVLGKGVGPGAAWQSVPPSFWTYSKGVTDWKHDPAAAKQLLAQAGHPNGVSIPMCFPSNLPTQLPSLLKQQLGQAGITLDLTVELVNTCQTKMQVQRSLATIFLGWSGRPDPYLQYQQLYASTGTLNAGRASYPGVDETLTKILAAYTQNEQKPLYEELNRQVYEAVPDAPIYYLPAVVSLSNRVRGYQPNIVGKIDATTLSFS
jgi:peptide/nickel transport system permease protein/peptide/nickel transport system substrate-binding protein